MSEIFLHFFNMSITAGYIVIAVMLLRIILKKAPKWITLTLWAVVALRLICPFSIESVLSLIPSAEVVSPEIMMDKTPKINTGIDILNSTLNPIISQSFTPKPEASANPLQILIPILSVVWLFGMAVLLVYMALSYLILKHRVKTAVLYENNIYQSENIISPFVLGVIKPKIYLPFYIERKDMEYVIAHEKAHIKRRDHLLKPLGFILLTAYWFNPIIWLGYVFFCRDIEFACDEKVIKDLEREARADYSSALLNCSVKGYKLTVCPLAFGESGVKSRVRSVLSYKKPAVWLIIASVLIIIALVFTFLTDPKANTEQTPPSPITSKTPELPSTTEAPISTDSWARPTDAPPAKEPSPLPDITEITSKYVYLDDDEYYILLPKSGQKVRVLYDIYENHLPFLKDEMIEAAEIKLLEIIEQYQNDEDAKTSGNIYIGLDDDYYLCLRIEVILSNLEVPDTEHIHGNDHKHVFFMERISEYQLYLPGWQN